MKIKGTVKTVRSKPRTSETADITFRIETPFDQAVSDQAELLCPDDCAITLRQGLDFQARLVHVQTDTNNRVTPGSEGKPRTVERRKILSLSFHMAHTNTLYRAMWGADKKEFEEIEIRQFQTEIFEGAGHQAEVERRSESADDDDGLASAPEEPAARAGRGRRGRPRLAVVNPA